MQCLLLCTIPQCAAAWVTVLGLLCNFKSSKDLMYRFTQSVSRGRSRYWKAPQQELQVFQPEDRLDSSYSAAGTYFSTI